MKIFITGFFAFIRLFGLSQQTDSLTNKKDKISFITKFNVDEDAGEDGKYYLNEYIVHID